MMLPRLRLRVKRVGGIGCKTCHFEHNGVHGIAALDSSHTIRFFYCNAVKQRSPGHASASLASRTRTLGQRRHKQSAEQSTSTASGGKPRPKSFRGPRLPFGLVNAPV